MSLTGLYGVLLNQGPAVNQIDLCISLRCWHTVCSVINHRRVFLVICVIVYSCKQLYWMFIVKCDPATGVTYRAVTYVDAYIMPAFNITPFTLDSVASLVIVKQSAAIYSYSYAVMGPVYFIYCFRMIIITMSACSTMLNFVPLLLLIFTHSYKL